MTPLGALIRSALDRQNLSVRRLEVIGGPPEATTRRLLSADPHANRNPPEDESLRRLSNAMRVPLARVYLAAAQTKGWVPVEQTSTPVEVTLLADALSRLDRQAAEALTDAFLSITEQTALTSRATPAATVTALPPRRGQGEKAGKGGVSRGAMAARRGTNTGRALRADLDAQAETPPPLPEEEP